MSRAVWWAKRDLRLADNDALHAALDAHDELLVLAVVEPSLFAAPDAAWFHYDAWREAVAALGQAVQLRGGQLLLRVGEVVATLDSLYREQGFDALYAHEEIGADITFRRDRAVRHWALEAGLPFHELPQSGVIRGLVDRGIRQPIIKARLVDTALRPTPVRLPGNGMGLVSDDWPEWRKLNALPGAASAQNVELQQVTEAAGDATLADFLQERGLGYSGGISSPNTAFVHGSRLSVHIAWGTLSLRTLHQRSTARLKAVQGAARQTDAEPEDGARARRWAKSLRAFQARLHWHDHFGQRLESAPFSEFMTLNPAYREIDYRDDGTHLAAWLEGQTGHPLVDASIRCLQATGFLNFRMRAMLVTVACFGLGIHWRDLQHRYARWFRDYEPGIHYPQVQMQAGLVGINTLRVYNPAKQLLDQDPDAVFVRRWIPELSSVPVPDILAYEKQPLPGYAPAINLAAANAAMKAQLHAVRSSDAGRAAAAQVLLEHGSRLSGSDRQSGLRARRSKAAEGRVVTPQLDLDL